LENFFTCCIHPGTVGLPTLAFATTLGQIRTALAITTTQYSGGDQFYVTFKYIMKDGRVFTNSNSNANVVGGAYMRSPFKYTLNVVCPITESLAGAHTYVTNMKAGSEEEFQEPAVAEPLPELLHLRYSNTRSLHYNGSWIRSIWIDLLGR
jgi:hypothetical protein